MFLLIFSSFMVSHIYREAVSIVPKSGYLLFRYGKNPGTLHHAINSNGFALPVVSLCAGVFSISVKTGTIARYALMMYSTQSL